MGRGRRSGGDSADLDPDDRVLAEGVERGDPEACAALVERHRPVLHRVAHRITGDGDAADGVVSRYTIRLLETGWGASGVPKDVPGFMCRAVERVALDARKQDGRRRERERQWSAPRRPARSPLGAAEDAEIRRKHSEALKLLSPRQREAYELVRRGFSVKAAANRMGATPKRVEKLLAEARARLRKALGPLYGSAPSSEPGGGGGILTDGGVYGIRSSLRLAQRG